MQHQLRNAFVVITLFASGCATRPQPLTIHEQGIFAIGGTVITAPGTFDPIKQGGCNTRDDTPPVLPQIPELAFGVSVRS